MRNTFSNQLFTPSPYNIGGISTINNQIRSHVIAVLNVKGATKTFEKPHFHVNYKNHKNQFLMQQDFTEVNEAFRRVKQLKHGSLNNKEPKSFQMRITNHSKYRNKQQYIEHAKNIQSLYNKITQLESKTKPQFRNFKKKENKQQSAKLPQRGTLSSHNSKQIFLHPRQQYFNLPKNSFRPLSAQIADQNKGKTRKFKKVNLMNNEDIQCFDYSQAMNNPEITKYNQAFEYPKINLTKEQQIEKEIRSLRIISQSFNEFLEKYNWPQILKAFLEIPNENFIGFDEFTLQLKELLVRLVVEHEIYEKRHYSELEIFTIIIFPESKEIIEEIFYEIETYLLK